jgi:hypothetical protein
MKRRKSIAPQTEIETLNERVERLENQIKSLRQSFTISMQADDYLALADPVPWEVMINHPGDHVDAEPTDAAVYYHPGLEDETGIQVTPGWKTLAQSAVASLQAPRFWFVQDSSVVVDYLPFGNQDYVNWSGNGTVIGTGANLVFEDADSYPTDFPVKLTKRGVYFIFAGLRWETAWGHLDLAWGGTGAFTHLPPLAPGVPLSMSTNYDPSAPASVDDFQHVVMGFIQMTANAINDATKGKPGLLYRNIGGSDRTSVNAAMAIYYFGDYV